MRFVLDCHSCISVISVTKECYQIGFFEAHWGASSLASLEDLFWLTFMVFQELLQGQTCKIKANKCGWSKPNVFAVCKYLYLIALYRFGGWFNPKTGHVSCSLASYHSHTLAHLCFYLMCACMKGSCVNCLSVQWKISKSASCCIYKLFTWQSNVCVPKQFYPPHFSNILIW